MAQFSLLPPDEATELADDIRELFDDLDRSLERGLRVYSGEYHPTLDVLETSRAIEIIVDVSGVPAAALRILFRGGVLLIAGQKAPAGAEPAQTFHLIEREFGRFARAVRLDGSFEVSEARATLRDGELRILMPKREERRNRGHRIPIQ